MTEHKLTMDSAIAETLAAKHRVTIHANRRSGRLTEYACYFFDRGSDIETHIPYAMANRSLTTLPI